MTWSAALSLTPSNWTISGRAISRRPCSAKASTTRLSCGDSERVANSTTFSSTKPRKILGSDSYSSRKKDGRDINLVHKTPYLKGFRRWFCKQSPKASVTNSQNPEPPLSDNTIKARTEGSSFHVSCGSRSELEDLPRRESR